MTRTVRDVLREHLAPGEDEGVTGPTTISDHGAIIDSILAGIREVLSTGEIWRTTPIEADALRAGDVIAAKDGRLWSVAQADEVEGSVLAMITRGTDERQVEWPATKTVPTLLAAQDARALALLEHELGGVTVEREVA